MAKPDLTFEQLRRRAQQQLLDHGIESAKLDVRLLLMDVSGLDAGDLILKAHDNVGEETLAEFEKLLAKRLAHEPIAYILGEKEFWSLSFKVSPDVLVPRPETELLVEQGLVLIKDIPDPKILDIGTGSGAILISLLHERKTAYGIGVDISEHALDLAQKNASTLGVADRSKFYGSDYLNGVDGRFDLIVSNPPYITDKAMMELPRTVGEFEPDLALRGGYDGLTAYRTIIADAEQVLNPEGWLAFEIGYDQAGAVTSLFQDHGFDLIMVKKDLAGLDRVVFAKISA